MIRIFTIFICVVLSSNTFANVLRVGVVDGDLVVDVTLRRLTNDTGIEFKIVRFNCYESIVRALKSNEIDLISNINFTEERGKVLDFTLPFSVDYSYVYSNKPISNSNVDIFYVKEGSAYPELIKRKDASLKVRTYTRSEQIPTILQNDNNVAVLGSINELEELLSQGYYAQRLLKSWFIPPAGFAVLKGTHKRYLPLLNLAIENRQYLSKSQSFIKRKERELRILALKSSVKLLGMNHSPTLYYKSEDLRRDGVAKDSSVSKLAIESACDLLGFNCVFSNKIDESWASIYNSLETRQIDMISSMAVSQKRSKYFNFSEIYYYPNVYFVSHMSNSERQLSLSELASERIGVIKGDYFQLLLQELLVGKTLYLFETQDDLTRALVNGDIDFMPIGSANYNKLMYETDYQLPIEVMKKFTLPIEYGIAIAFQNNEQGEIYAKLFSEAMEIVNFPKLISRFNDKKNWRTALIEVQNLLIIGAALIAIIGVIMFLVIIALYKESLTDQLTNLGNRRALYRKANAHLAANTVLIYVDINKFKFINDTYGHEAGDFVLERYAHIISNRWPGNSYRIGGDEFILLLKKLTPGLSQTMLQLKSFKVCVDGMQIDIETSIGSLIVEEGGMSLSEALAEVDRRMYKDKQN